MICKRRTKLRKISNEDGHGRGLVYYMEQGQGKPAK